MSDLLLQFLCFSVPGFYSFTLSKKISLCLPGIIFIVGSNISDWFHSFIHIGGSAVSVTIIYLRHTCLICIISHYFISSVSMSGVLVDGDALAWKKLCHNLIDVTSIWDHDLPKHQPSASSFLPALCFFFWSLFPVNKMSYCCHIVSKFY